MKGGNVTMEDVVGAKVLIHLHRHAYDMLDLQGVESERFVARVVGLDTFGMWIENPNYCVVPVYDDEGNYIAPENRAEVCHRALVLIMWPYVQTLIQFPERTVFSPGAEEEEIGFRSRLKEHHNG